MQLREKMAVVFLTSVLLVLSFTDLTLQFEWNVLGSKCEDYPAKVESCWTEKYHIPDCDDKDSLLECAEEAKNDVRHCKEDIKQSINSQYAVIKALRDAICEDYDLRNEFVNRPSCWHTARLCASSLAKVSDDDVDEEVCSQMLEELETCNTLSGSGICQEMQQNFTLEVFQASACESHADKLLGLESAAHFSTSSIILVALATIFVAAAI